MTKDEALKLSLEALKFGLHVGFDESSESQIKKGGKAFDQHSKAITAIKEALAESEQESDWKDDVIQQHEKTILWQTKRIAELIRRLAAIMQHPE